MPRIIPSRRMLDLNNYRPLCKFVSFTSQTDFPWLQMYPRSPSIWVQYGCAALVSDSSAFWSIKKAYAS